MKLLFFFFLFLYVYSFPLMSAPTSYIGLTPQDRQTLSQRGLLKSNLSLSEANHLIKEIFKLGHYEKAELVTVKKNGQIYWEIRTSSNRTIKEVQITGHKAFSRNEIITLLNTPVGHVFIQQQLTMAIDRIKKQYEDQGYFNVKIDLDLEDTPDKGVLIKINIAEGAVCKIDSIVFITPHKRITNLLSKKSKSYRGDAYTKERLITIKENLQEFLFKKQYFRASFLEPHRQFNEDKTRVDLTYEIENAYLFFIHLNISNQESRSSIPYKRQPLTKPDVLKSLSLNTAESFGSLMTLSQRIRNLYKSKGYSKVQVSASEKILQDNFEHHVFFNINPGHLFYVRQIEVTDMSKKQNQEYLNILRSHRSYFSKIAEVYVKDDILKDVNKLITTLQNQGHLKARMQSLTEKFHDQEREVTVRVAINEGPLTMLRSVEFKGNEQISNEELLEILKLNTGQSLNLSALEESFDILREYYLQRGFLDFRINNPNDVVQYYENDTQADVVFDLYEGPQVEVGNILIQGNEITQQDVILKELAFQPGSILTRDLIRDSQYSLQQTGLFSSVDITLPEAGSSLKQRTVLIRVTEQNPGFLRFILGVNNEFDFTLRSIVGVGYRNLWGTARGINTRLELGYTDDLSFLQHNIGISYYEPFVFGSKTRGQVHIINSRDIISRTRLQNERFIRKRTSLHFLLEREIDRRITFSYSLWKLNFERMYGELSGDNKEVSVIGSTGPGIELDYRNDPFNTTKGTYSVFNLDFADPLLSPTKSDIRFISILGGVNVYTPLFAHFVLANSIRGGYITNLNRGVSEIPESRVFLLGGQSSIRGYELNSIPNRSDLLDDDDSLTILTDSYFYLLKSELRFPIFKALGGVLFYDGGGVNISQRHQEDEYKDSIGLGFRISTPVGPVSIEYGFKLRDENNSFLENLHFSIGAF